MGKKFGSTFRYKIDIGSSDISKTSVPIHSPNIYTFQCNVRVYYTCREELYDDGLFILGLFVAGMFCCRSPPLIQYTLFLVVCIHLSLFRCAPSSSSSLFFIFVWRVFVFAVAHTCLFLLSVAIRMFSVLLSLASPLLCLCCLLLLMFFACFCLLFFVALSFISVLVTNVAYLVSSCPMPLLLFF